MIRLTTLLATASLFALGACAVAPPPGPTVAALPGKGKTFEAFRQDDNYCRQYASEQTGNADPAQAATASAVGSAALGTALGAATGALIGAAAGGAGVGAAIGAGAGLIGGSAIGGANAQASAGAIQARYDQSYSQCMFGQGDTVTQPQQTYAAAPGYAYPPPAYYGPAYVAPPPVVFGGPSVVIGGGYYGGGYYRGGYYRGGYRGPYWR